MRCNDLKYALLTLELFLRTLGNLLIPVAVVASGTNGTHSLYGEKLLIVSPFRRPDRRSKKLGKRCVKSADRVGVQKYRKIISQEIKALDNAHIEDNSKNVQNSADQTNPAEVTESIPLLDLYPTQMPHPRTKIKLQLFPINEKTRMALEKEGYHPYLELTLKARKKMSSVLNHLISKWGSNVARGELTLFPYSNSSSLVSGLKWTLEDCDISAGDVYAAVGGPSIFRLRYGWVSTSVPKFHSFSKGLEKGCSSTLQIIHGEGKQSARTMDEIKSSNMNEGKNTAAPDKTVGCRTNPMGNEPPLDSGRQSSSECGILQFDSISNISMGGLLSEASLMGKFSSWDPKTTGGNASVQPAEVITDSLDACIAAAQMRFSGVSKQPHNEHHSSILDAEQTCDAFSMKRLPSSSKDTLSLDASTRGTFQDADSKLFKFPKTPQAHSRSDLSQDPAGKESKTDLTFCSRVYHDESSLGLSGINWSDSLGPFDLGLAVSRKVSSSGDSLSSGFVR
ncbi:TSL-kinase interacting protein 1 isoform X1 [Cucumis melo var. makuwa]|uniref:TSL-kinase interacting protein 1 isoform X1 n=1 Tax=Cucumis melo var. makuwa TaxID=1194695 RepID=A0A5D3CMD4_CUCMM|nr:TSL-kinase interacting protein 1 isoform X1 [Cucumis melo var. makuwa]